MADKKMDEEMKKATVLSFEKKLVPSDGYMYGTTWGEWDTLTPLHITQKRLRGTIANRRDPKESDPAKLNADLRDPNLQVIDNASLPLSQDTLAVHFTLKVLPNVQYPSACNSTDKYKAILKFADSYIKENKFTTLSLRYAMNLANGRFLWRNRVGAEQLKIFITVVGTDTKFEFDGYDFGLDTFELDNVHNSNAKEQVQELAGLIAAALCGQYRALLLDIKAYAQVGNGQDVYPSQEMIMEKGKYLYQVEGIAAMHSQKLGNAIRTIDTWYPGYGEIYTHPIAIEPFGAVTNLGEAYRQPTDKRDFYTLFDNWCKGKQPEHVGDKDYVMAVLIRGGVFSESDDKKKGQKK